MFDKSRLTDTTLSIEERVDLLLAEMTLEEKVAQLWGVWTTDMVDDQKNFLPERARELIPHGVGQLSRLGATSMTPPDQSARRGNVIQRFLVEETRLGIPAVVHEESCAGYLALGATSFPQAIGLAATWTPELVEQMADAIRQQMRAVGAHHTLAPVLDVVRDARWGRVEETFGEDPFLISSIGSAYVRGIQSADWQQGVIATAKHFMGYGLSEGGMNWAPSHLPERELREVIMTPFAAVIKEANIGSVMNGYQELDGIPCGSSRWLLTDVLRGELGFTGTVVADYFTVNMLKEYHHVAATKGEAAQMALEAGIDIELPGVDCYGQPLLDALAAGQVDPALVDIAVRRVLRQKFALGLFENPYVDEGSVLDVYNTPQQIALSRQLAQKSIVLLKNDGDLLPLNPALKSIAVIGPNADSVRRLQGDYHYPAHLLSLAGLGEGMDAPTPGQDYAIQWDGHFPPTTTVLQGIQAAVSTETQVLYAPGCHVTADDRSGFASAVEAAQQAEVAVVVVGDQSGLGQGSTVGEAIDRATLDLPGIQQALIEAVQATGTPTVVVLVTGRPYAITWIDEHIPAVLEAWLPAQEGGAAITDVLFGSVNPGGKLPMSFPRAVGQVPLYYNHKPSGGRSHWYGDYADLSAKPLYPFGHGLCYTSFDYCDLRITPEAVGPTGTVTVALDVTNSGSRSGDEVVQLYVHDVLATVTRPVKQLKGFKRLTLQPGERQTVTFSLDVRHLAFYDRAMQYVVEPGVIEVLVGSSSDDIRLQGEFTINGQTTPVEAVYSTPVTVEG